jgi:hypothetical protein
MQIEFELASSIAEAAITEPYRQTSVLTTRDFARFLKDRGISLHWETIHFFWKLGIIHPITVLEPAITQDMDRRRFCRLDLKFEVDSFVDLGQDASENLEWSLPIGRLPGYLADSLLWHPFQLWIFQQLARRLEVPIALEASISPESYAKLTRKLVSSVPKMVTELANGDQHIAFLQVLSLLLQIEPVVHISIDNSVSLHPHLGESLDGYFAWREGFKGQAVLSSIGLTVEEVENWWRNFAVAAHISDPVNKFRILLRHANRRKLKGLEGAALLAVDLYDAAEVLRRYLEQYCGRELLEEDDAIHGPQGPEVKKRLYGSVRTSDFKRSVFRRIVREFDLDPQARTTWFVEGATEEAYIKDMAHHLNIDLDQAGLEIMNVHGLGGLASDKLRALLERFKKEEIFSFVSIDHDRCTKHIHDIQNYAEQGMLPIGYQIWEPDFELANFSLTELAGIANKIAADAGVTVDIKTEDVQKGIDKGKPVGEVIKKLWSKYRYYGGKGEDLGKALAEWANNHSCPKEKADKDGDRRINSILFWLLRGQQSEYWGTTAHFKVDDNGKLVERKAD